jgi:hypothetical protein
MWTLARYAVKECLGGSPSPVVPVIDLMILMILMQAVVSTIRRWSAHASLVPLVPASRSVGARVLVEGVAEPVGPLLRLE